MFHVFSLTPLPRILVRILSCFYVVDVFEGDFFPVAISLNYIGRLVLKQLISISPVFYFRRTVLPNLQREEPHRHELPAC